MYKKMVVLLDGSRLAEVVFDYAQELAGRMHLDIDLLHVCSPQQAEELPMRHAYMDRMAEQLCAKAEQIRVEHATDATPQCILAKGNVVVGYPAEEILKFIEEHQIDLVMMSTHGSTGPKDWHIGEVTNKVVHASKAPVWLVPTELREEVLADVLPGRPLVVPLSGSKQSEAAVSHAAEIIKQRGARGESELVLLHVVEEPFGGSYAYVDRTALQRLDAPRVEAQKYLEGVARPLTESGLAVRTEVLTGDPAESIISYLKGNPTQLLVMATRGKSRLNRMIFGSVTESMIHMVKVTPLLLVGGED